MGAPIVTGHLVAGRYRLLAALGNGGMGTVWRAEDELLARPVRPAEAGPVGQHAAVHVTADRGYPGRLA